MAVELDHLVVNTRFETDAALEIFEALGFTVTPRGHHTLGSINHLMVFPGAYLELIGLPPGGQPLRQEILDSHRGIDGLVLRSDDPEATHDQLRARGFEVGPVQHFSREVALDDGVHQASFATVRLRPGQIAAGRVYYCQHLTPELVWRDEWMSHANGVEAIVGVTVASADVETTRATLDRLGVSGAAKGGFATEVLDVAALGERFGEPAASLKAGEERFVAVTLRARELAPLLERVRAVGLPLELDREGWRLVVAMPEQALLLEVVHG